VLWPVDLVLGLHPIRDRSNSPDFIVHPTLLFGRQATVLELTGNSRLSGAARVGRTPLPIPLAPIEAD
jgi:hypothetical protein